MFNTPIMQGEDRVGDPQPGEVVDNPIYKKIIIPNVKEYRRISPNNSEEITTPFQARHIFVINPTANNVYIRTGGTGPGGPLSSDLSVLAWSWVSLPISPSTIFSATSVTLGATQSIQQLAIYFYDSPMEPGAGILPGGGTPVLFVPVAATVTAETAIWTPTAGKRFRLMGFHLTQGTVTGAVTLRDGTGGSTIYTIPANTIGVALMSPYMGEGILSSGINKALTAQGTATETITGVVFGREES